MLDITKIKDNLWQGAYPGKELPKEIGIVVNLSSECPPESYHEDMKGLLWMPTTDGVYPGIDWLHTCVNYVSASISDGHNVLVHCLAGRSRSTLVVAAYMIKRTGGSVDDALNYIASKRPVICPEPIYVKALQEYAKEVTRFVS